MKTVVLGMGNPILSDDSVGIRVARALEDRVDTTRVTIIESSVGGLELLEMLVGFDKAILIDSIQTVDGKVGHIYQLTSEAFNNTRYATSAHDVNFATAIELGYKLNLAVPKQITIFAIEVRDVTTFSESCCPEVEACIPIAVEKVLHALQQQDS